MSEEQPKIKMKKYRGIAFLLALFFGPLTWIYTYKYDGWKFWLAIVLDIIGVLTTFIFVGFLIMLFVYLWAIIDVLIKPSEFYDNYYYK